MGRSAAGSAPAEESALRAARTAVSSRLGPLSLEGPLAFAELKAEVEAVYGKRIEFAALDDGLVASCTGLWVERAESATILYRPLDPPVYRAHSVLHEFGHILMGHGGCDLMGIVTAPRILKDGLGGSIRKIRQRALRAHPEELEAEEAARMLGHLLLRGDVEQPEARVFG